MVSLISLGAFLGAGGIVAGSAVFGFFLRRIFSGEKIFTPQRPGWIGLLTWVYLTFAFLAWIGFFEQPTWVTLFIAAILTLMAAKFFLFFLFYFKLQTASVLIWNHFSAGYVILGSLLLVGTIMISALFWLL